MENSRRSTQLGGTRRQRQLRPALLCYINCSLISGMFEPKLLPPRQLCPPGVPPGNATVDPSPSRCTPQLWPAMAITETLLGCGLEGAVLEEREAMNTFSASTTECLMPCTALSRRILTTSPREAAAAAKSLGPCDVDRRVGAGGAASSTTAGADSRTDSRTDSSSNAS